MAVTAIGSTTNAEDVEDGDGAGASSCAFSMAAGGTGLQERLTVEVNRLPKAKVVKQSPTSAPLEIVDAEPARWTGIDAA